MDLMVLSRCETRPFPWERAWREDDAVQVGLPLNVAAGRGSILLVSAGPPDASFMVMLQAELCLAVRLLAANDAKSLSQLPELIFSLPRNVRLGQIVDDFHCRAGA